VSLYDAIKDAANMARKADNIDLYQKVLDLQAQALDEQEETARLRTRVRELEADVDRLRGELVFAGSLNYDLGIQAYVQRDERGGENALFCSRCWDARRLAMRLRDYGNGFWGCPECQSSIKYSGSRR
jgi:hypothetical protein